jgi:hypothetical protein
MEGVGILNASSYSGGVEFLGMIPGSLPEVNKRNKKSRKVRTRPPIITGNQKE